MTPFSALGPAAKPLGLVAEDKTSIYFFGTRHCGETELRQLFSGLEFSRTQQVHGSDWAESKPVHIGQMAPSVKADAQWSQSENLGLIVSTADCLPILISGPNFVAAVHAGWRGVKNEIVLKGLTQLQKKYSFRGDELTVCIGPHIHAENFEVDRELAQDFSQLYDSYFDQYSHLTAAMRTDVVLPHSSNQKAYVNLLAVALAQLGAFGIPRQNIADVKVNTYTSADYSSFRRDKAVGRNFSFVARRPRKE